MKKKTGNSKSNLKAVSAKEKALSSTEEKKTVGSYRNPPK